MGFKVTLMSGEYSVSFDVNSGFGVASMGSMFRCVPWGVQGDLWVLK